MSKEKTKVYVKARKRSILAEKVCGDNIYKELVFFDNYRIRTVAIKDNLLPPGLTPEQVSFQYASEADMLNVALPGLHPCIHRLAPLDTV